MINKQTEHLINDRKNLIYKYQLKIQKMLFYKNVMSIKRLINLFILIQIPVFINMN